MNLHSLLITGFLLITTLLKAQDPVTIIRKYIELTGGETKWGAVETCKIIGRSSYNDWNLNDSIETPKMFSIYRKWPDKQRIDFYKDSILTESSIYSGGKGIINSQLLSIELDILVYHDFYPQQLIKMVNSKEYSIIIKPIEVKNGEEFTLIEISGKNFKGCYYFNREGLLMYEKNSSAPDVTTSITDYRKVGEYLLPYKISKSRNGNLFYSEETLEINLNVPIPSNKFFIK